MSMRPRSGTRSSAAAIRPAIPGMSRSSPAPCRCQGRGVRDDPWPCGHRMTIRLAECRFSYAPRAGPVATAIECRNQEKATLNSLRSRLVTEEASMVKRRGDKKAIVAVAHSILVIAYHVLRDGQCYREL